jgi:hypothetical protein
MELFGCGDVTGAGLEKAEEIEKKLTKENFLNYSSLIYLNIIESK